MEDSKVKGLSPFERILGDPLGKMSGKVLTLAKDGGPGSYKWSTPEESKEARIIEILCSQYYEKSRSANVEIEVVDRKVIRAPVLQIEIDFIQSDQASDAYTLLGSVPMYLRMDNYQYETNPSCDNPESTLTFSGMLHVNKSETPLVESISGKVTDMMFRVENGGAPSPFANAIIKVINGKMAGDHDGMWPLDNPIEVSFYAGIYMYITVQIKFDKYSGKLKITERVGPDLSIIEI